VAGLAAAVFLLTAFFAGAGLPLPAEGLAAVGLAAGALAFCGTVFLVVALLPAWLLA
jgi:hypothetical protein